MPSKKVNHEGIAYLLLCTNGTTITIYYFINDFFQSYWQKEDVHCNLTDPKILTTALIRSRYLHENLHIACDYMQAYHKVNMIDKSGFIRYLHKL